MPIKIDQDNQLDIRFYTDPPTNIMEITTQTHYFGPTATLFFLYCAQHQQATGGQQLAVSAATLGKQLGVTGPKVNKMILRLERLNGIRLRRGTIEITRYPLSYSDYIE